MKQYILASMMVLVSTVAMAQTSGVSTAKAVNGPGPKTAGVKMGLNYSNLTDIYLKTENTLRKNSPKVSSTADGRTGDSMSVLGVSLGYKDNYAFGNFGYDSSATVYKALNTSQADAKMTIIKLQGDVVYPITDAFSFLGGLSLSHVDGFATGDYTTKPGTGFQLGLQYEKNGIGLLFAHQTLGFNVNGSFTNPYSGYKAETDETISSSGLLTQVSYTF